MFCSLLQEHLGFGYSDAFVEGSLQRINLAQDVRLRIHEQIRRIYHIPSPGKVGLPKHAQRSSIIDCKL